MGEEVFEVSVGTILEDHGELIDPLAIGGEEVGVAAHLDDVGSLYAYVGLDLL
jgi:hypothetical protein